MRAYDFQIRVTEDDSSPIVEIAQDEPYGNDPHRIWLNPDQIDMMIEWLRKAQAEARQAK